MDDLERLATEARCEHPLMAGKSVPADVLLTWLFRNHWHDLDGDEHPRVDSYALEQFIRRIAA